MKDWRFYFNSSMDKVILDFSDNWRQIFVNCFGVVEYVFNSVNKTIGGDTVNYRNPINFKLFF